MSVQHDRAVSPALLWTVRKLSAWCAARDNHEPKYGHACLIVCASPAKKKHHKITSFEHQTRHPSCALDKMSEDIPLNCNGYNFYPMSIWLHRHWDKGIEILGGLPWNDQLSCLTEQASCLWPLKPVSFIYLCSCTICTKSTQINYFCSCLSNTFVVAYYHSLEIFNQTRAWQDLMGLNWMSGWVWTYSHIFWSFSLVWA